MFKTKILIAAGSSLHHFLYLLLFGCAALPASAQPDSVLFETLLQKGNSVYREKAGYASFERSLKYFDSAQLVAEKTGDKIMQAQATFARGRVYDAWGQQPAKTIELFTKATSQFKAAGEERQYQYVKHLIAHAYDKVQDSLHATAILREMFGELILKDTAFRRGLIFIPEMALVATEVRAYTLADSILRFLTRREWIANDPETYNYLDHYYLTQSRLEVYGWKKARSLFTDSLEYSYQQLAAPMDKMYYAAQLAALHSETGNFEKAYHFRTIQQKLGGELVLGNSFEEMQRALVASETAAQSRKLAYESAISRSRTYTLWALSSLLLVITILSIYLFRRNRKYREQSQNLLQLNTELDQQAGKVTLLNKEIQHRIKNNLYTIYSLLHMQQESTDNEEVIAHLEAARMRVESVAALHDHLLAGSENVDFSAYLKVLVGKIVDCFSEERKVITHIHAETVSLPMNTCFALSLILNEWITNTIKHARSKGEMLEMEIRIANKPGQVCITYLDNGDPPNRKSEKQGLGSEIIRLLTAQIRGSIVHPGNHPYHYYLCLSPKNDGQQN